MSNVPPPLRVRAMAGRAAPIDVRATMGKKGEKARKKGEKARKKGEKARKKGEREKDEGNSTFREEENTFTVFSLLPAELQQRILFFFLCHGEQERVARLVCTHWRDAVDRESDWDATHHFAGVPFLHWTSLRHIYYSWKWSVLLPYNERQRLDNAIGTAQAQRRKRMGVLALTIFNLIHPLERILADAAAFGISFRTYAIVADYVIFDCVALHGGWRSTSSRSRILDLADVLEILRALILLPLLSWRSNGVWSALLAWGLLNVTSLQRSTRIEFEMALFESTEVEHKYLPRTRNRAVFLYLIWYVWLTYSFHWYHVFTLCAAVVPIRMIRAHLAGGKFLSSTLRRHTSALSTIVVAGACTCGIWKFAECMAGSNRWMCLVHGVFSLGPIIQIGVVSVVFMLLLLLAAPTTANTRDFEVLADVVGRRTQHLVRIPCYRRSVLPYHRYHIGLTIIMCASTLLLVVLEITAVAVAAKHELVE